MSQEKVRELVAALSLEQKAQLISGDGPWHTADLSEAGIPPIMVTDGPGGLRKVDDPSDGPDLFGSEVATCFPPAVALASSWNPDVVEAVGESIGEEAAEAGVGVVLGPGVNLKRSIRCGRNFEYYSEDPLLAGRMGAAWVRGVQSKGVGSSLKHFATNNQETDRMRINVDVDMRTLQEMYLRAFRHVVTNEQPWTVMCAYNKLLGDFCSQNQWLLTETLRSEWGFEGLVMSDWGAVHDPARAAEAGLDLEMPGTAGWSAAKIVEAVESGDLKQSDLDAVATRVTELVLKVQEANPELPKNGGGSVSEQLLERHNEVSVSAAAECIVLLENDGVLPLSPDTPNSDLVVIGAFATEPRFQGAGSSQVNSWKVAAPLDAIAKRVGEVRFEPGFRLDKAEDPELEDRAVRAAAAAKVAIVFLGLPAVEESEGYDREHIDLPENQLDLLDQIMGVNDKVIVILSNGGVVAVTPWATEVSALVEGWLLGQGSGEALARVLFGEVSPSGRLAETIPHRLEDTCDYVNFPGESGQVVYGERGFVGYRWYDELLLDVAYPFGHGLTYSTFEYKNLEVSVDEDEMVVSFEVANTGDFDAAEVAQVYVGKRGSKLRRAERELKAFAKVFLEAGEKTRLDLVISSDDLSYFNVVEGQWLVEEGEYQIEVGASSRDIRLTESVELEGNEPEKLLRMDDQVLEWLNHPVSGPILHEAIVAFGIDPEGELIAFARQMPMEAFVGMVPIDNAREVFAQLEQAVNQGVDPAGIATTFKELLSK